VPRALLSCSRCGPGKGLEVATSSVAASAYKADPGRPLLYLFLSANDGSGATYSRAGVNALLTAANGVENTWAATVDAALAAGFDGFEISWYAGQADETKQQNIVGRSPVALGDDDVVCTPITEAQGLVISSSDAAYVTYLENLSHFVADRAALMCRPIFYCGCAGANADPTAWASEVPTAVAVNAMVAFDAVSPLDFTVPRCSIAAIDVINSPGGIVKVHFVAHGDDIDTGTGNPPLNGEAIDIWADSSGNTNSATGSLTARPTFRSTDGPGGLACVRFDGTNDTLALGATVATTNYTFFAVQKSTSGTVTPIIGSAAAWAGFDAGNLAKVVDDGGLDANTSVDAAARSAWGLLSITNFADGPSFGPYFNGATLTDAGASITGTSSFSRIAHNNTAFMAGDLYSIALCDSIIAANLRSLVEKGLGTETGITVAGSPTLPQRALWTGLIAADIMVLMEGWSRKDLVSEIVAWGAEAAAGGCFGGQIAITNHHKATFNPNDTNTWGSADYNSADGPGSTTYQNEYNIATDYDNGVGNPPVRPWVLITGETLAARIAEMALWVAKGCSVIIEADTGFASVKAAFDLAQLTGRSALVRTDRYRSIRPLR